MKILHLLSSSSFSGAENVACQIISMFNCDNNFEMIYCSPNGPISSSLKERGIKFLPLQRFNFKFIKKAVYEYNPDIIHAHDVSASIYAAMLPKKYAVISHMHVNNKDMSKVSFKSIIYKFSCKRYKHIFWVSTSAYNNYRFRNDIVEKSSVLYNIIDKSSLYERLNNDDNSYNYDIVYVGRLTYQKNPERLIDIIRLVFDKYPALKVAIVGNGDLLQSLKKYVETKGLLNVVDFLGYKENPVKILKSSKLMIMTSRFEGTPMIALEAMCLGTPVVSTPTDGMVDLIKNSVNGYLSDDDTQLAEYSLAIIQNDILRSELSAASIKMYDKYCNICSYKKAICNSYYSK